MRLQPRKFISDGEKERRIFPGFSRWSFLWELRDVRDRRKVSKRERKGGSEGHCIWGEERVAAC